MISRLANTKLTDEEYDKALLPGVEALESGYDIVAGTLRGKLFKFPKPTKPSYKEFFYPEEVVQYKPSKSRSNNSVSRRLKKDKLVIALSFSNFCCDL